MASLQVFAPLGSATINYRYWAVVFTLLGIVAFDLAAVEAFRSGIAEAFSAESGPLEETQMLLIACAFGLFWASARRSSGTFQVASVLLAMLLAATFIREIDFKAAERFLSASGHMRDVLLAAMAVAALGYAGLQLNRASALGRLLWRPQSWPLVVALIVLGAAELVFDRIDGPTARFFEEWTEVHGYLLLTVAAWMHLRLAGTTEGGANARR